MENFTLLALNFINKFHPEYLADGIKISPPDDCLCYEEIAPVPLLDPFVVLPCYHVLHGHCLMRILKTDSRCPYCREFMNIEIENESTIDQPMDNDTGTDSGFIEESEFIEENEDSDSSYLPSQESSNEDENVPLSSALDRNDHENAGDTISSLQPESNRNSLQGSPNDAQDVFSEYADELRSHSIIPFNSLREQSPGFNENSEGRRWAREVRNRNKKRIISRVQEEINEEESQRDSFHEPEHTNFEDNGVATNISLLTFDSSRQTTGLDANDISATIQSSYQQQTQKLFSRLLRKILHAEVRCNRETQEAVRSYFRLGKAMEERLDEIQTSDPTCTRHTAKTRLNNELVQQLPVGMTRTQLYAMKTRAKKIYRLFSVVGEDKICRIHSLSADMISKLTLEDIQGIIDNDMPFDYNIQVEPGQELL